MEANKIIEHLLEKKQTKWKISKIIGVSWRTVRQWQTKKVTPNEINKKKLEELYFNVTEKRGKNEEM